MHLVITVQVSNRQQTVSMDGGITSPRRINGAFTTNNPFLQAAIEKHPEFGKSFELIKTVKIETAPPPVEKKEEEPEVVKYVSKAKNAQEARQELRDKFHIKLSELKNAAAVLNQAEKFNISYPDWERE